LLDFLQAHLTEAVHSLGGRVDKAASDPVEKQFLSAFAEGTFTRVDVLGYGDDPDVEPGETAVRAFIDQSGKPEEDWGSRAALDDFVEARSEGIEKLRDGLLPSLAWVEFTTDSSGRQAKPHSLGWGSTRLWWQPV
jgi:hypothetical protein